MVDHVDHSGYNSELCSLSNQRITIYTTVTLKTSKYKQPIHKEKEDITKHLQKAMAGAGGVS